MFVVNWFKDLLYDWNILKKSATILLLGIDNAGKTTLLHMLRDNRLVQHKPTRNPTSEQLQMNHVTFSAFDLGGHREARRLWKDYMGSVDAVVYIVDVADSERLSETKGELDSLLSDELLDDVPFVILGNKIDVSGALSKVEFLDRFGLMTQCTGDSEEYQRSLEVFMCSIANREGYAEAFNWLIKRL